MNVKNFLYYFVLSINVISALSILDEDTAFDDNSLDVDGTISKIMPVHRVWGIPDTQALVGKLFTLTVPLNSFKGDIDFFEASIKNIDGIEEWPKWLYFEKQGVLKGVPISSDAGTYYVSITAVSPKALYKSKDIFALEVIQPGLDVKILETFIEKNNCSKNSDPIMLTIFLNTTMKNLDSKNRIGIIENIAGYLGLNQNNFFLHEGTALHNNWEFPDTLYYKEGPGHANNTFHSDLTALSFQIGCGRKLEKESRSLIEKIKTEALDGTLSEVVLHPIVRWHAKNELPIYSRNKRQVGSGDQYEEEEDDEDDYNESMTTTSLPHPHRHHHGENFNFINISSVIPSQVQYNLPSTSLLIDYDDYLISTPLFTLTRPTEKILLKPTQAYNYNYNSFTTSTTPNIFHEEKIEKDYSEAVTIPLSYGSSEINVTDRTDIYTEWNATAQISTDLLTTNNLKAFNISSKITTTEESEPRNFKPTISHRLKKVAATAGKILKFKIPENTFSDIEDGSTKHMSLTFKTQEGKSIPYDSWIKFDSLNQEILAIPLEEHVSKWEFEVVATDKDGDSVSDTFSLQIQHHKGQRTVNFEFSAEIILTKDWMFSFDWQEKILQALVEVYGDQDSSFLTVRSVNQRKIPFFFKWTNDTLPRSYCPRNDIENLFKVIANDNGDITETFQKALGEGISVKRLSIIGLGQCETKSEISTILPPQNPHSNFSPVPRNQIDQVNASAGCLLIFKVPEDTCYDPEDGSTRKLKLSLLNMDRTELDIQQWLQFDTKNQEFYGVPMDSDVSSQEYQLVCEDKEGLTANDGLVVVVFPRPKRLFNVEFTIAIDVSYDMFINNSALKRKFMEKLQELFGDMNANSIVLGKISEGSTIITWYNQSLPTENCPTDEIHRLREVLINDDESMSDRLVSIMGHEFPVISVGLEPAGACQGELTVLHKPESSSPSIDENLFPIGITDDYLFTFVIPAILIALMLILSGVIACLFYRKRYSNKMGIGTENEKQSFRNKGIPVIFQDELEEKPEPENKCPVIMKEEKPPLPPPEYQKSHQDTWMQEINDDTPYQPPPPFTFSKDTGRNIRPKPTPTYRKPPPYVPP